MKNTYSDTSANEFFG